MCHAGANGIGAQQAGWTWNPRHHHDQVRNFRVGKVRFTRLSNSSGNSILDKAALAAVQRTSFPVPPQGMQRAADYLNGLHPIDQREAA
jgi:hypothetical protein